MTRAVIDRGRKSYGYYCVQCHGPRLNGKATVGQSFYPLPTDLLDPRVQAQKDGELFFKISLGYKRQPPLYATVAGRTSGPSSTIFGPWPKITTKGRPPDEHRTGGPFPDRIVGQPSLPGDVRSFGHGLLAKT